MGVRVRAWRVSSSEGFAKATRVWARGRHRGRAMLQLPLGHYFLGCCRLRHYFLGCFLCLPLPGKKLEHAPYVPRGGGPQGQGMGGRAQGLMRSRCMANTVAASTAKNNTGPKATALALWCGLKRKYTQDHDSKSALPLKRLCSQEEGECKPLGSGIVVGKRNILWSTL